MVALLDLKLPVFLSFSTDYIQVVGRFVPTTQHNCSEHTVYCAAPVIQFDIGAPPANHLYQAKANISEGVLLGNFLLFLGLKGCLNRANIIRINIFLMSFMFAVGLTKVEKSQMERTQLKRLFIMLFLEK